MVEKGDKDLAKILDKIGCSGRERVLNLETTKLENLPYLYQKSDGTLLLFGSPSTMHGQVSMNVALNIYLELTRCGVPTNSFSMSNEAGCLIGDVERAHDFCIFDALRPVELFGDREGNNFPSFVAEIAIKNENEFRLMEKLELWTGPYTSVNAALGIKIHRKNLDGSRTMSIFLKERDRDVIQLYFGTDLEEPLPQIFPIPVRTIIPSARNISDDVEIDLEMIREKVFATSIIY